MKKLIHHGLNLNSCYKYEFSGRCYLATTRVYPEEQGLPSNLVLQGDDHDHEYEVRIMMISIMVIMIVIVCSGLRAPRGWGAKKGYGKCP